MAEIKKHWYEENLELLAAERNAMSDFLGDKVVKSKFVCKLPSGRTADNYAARSAACFLAIRCR